MRCASSAIWPAISTPVGPAPTTTKVSRWSTSSPRERAELGELEGAEDPAAQLERVVDALHAGRELGELVVAEVGLAGAGRHDQRVVRRHRLAAEHVRGDRARLEVDVGDLAEEHPGVAAGRRAPRGSAGRSRPRRGCRSPPGRAAAGTGGGWSCAITVTSTSARLQRLGAEQAPEAGPDHHHLVPVAGGALTFVMAGLSLARSSGLSCYPFSAFTRHNASRVHRVHCRAAWPVPHSPAPRRGDRSPTCSAGHSGHDGRVSTTTTSPSSAPARATRSSTTGSPTGGSRSSRRARFGGTCLNVGLHPHQDVRLPGRPRALRGARRPRSASRPASTGPAGRRSGTGSSGGSTRSPTAAALAGRRERPNVTLFEGHARFVDVPHPRHRHRARRSPPTRS